MRMWDRRHLVWRSARWRAVPTRRAPLCTASQVAQPADGAALPAWEEQCHQALAICQFPKALDAARRSGNAALLREVALTALHLLRVHTAVEAYQLAGAAPCPAALCAACHGAGRMRACCWGLHHVLCSTDCQ